MNKIKIEPLLKLQLIKFFSDMELTETIEERNKIYENTIKNIVEIFKKYYEIKHSETQ